jgi:predicted amidophosphoribosyltransferase
MRELWRELQQELTSLALPVDCVGCGLPRVRGQLCGECAGALTEAAPRRVWPSPVPAGLPPVYASTPYADAARAVLLAHKERGALRLAAPLGTALATAVGAAVARAGARTPARYRAVGPLTLVPVPSAPRAVAARGHDPVRRLALAAARQLRRAGVPARVLPVLWQRRPVADQSALTARERAANLEGALEAAPGSGGLPAEGETVIVDDLMTTGATLAEAARAVRAAGGYPAGAAVIATRAIPGGTTRN